MDAITRTDSDGLAELFRLGNGLDKLSSEALQDSLEHLLSLPIDSALNQLPQDLARKLRQEFSRVREVPGSRVTFEQLFQQAPPSLAMLKFAKQFGKELCRRDDCIWPPKVGEVIYYASYASALSNWGQPIGNLSGAELQKAFARQAGRTWINQKLRGLFRG